MFSRHSPFPYRVITTMLLLQLSSICGCRFMLIRR